MSGSALCAAAGAAPQVRGVVCLGVSLGLEWFEVGFRREPFYCEVGKLGRYLVVGESFDAPLDLIF